MEIKYVFAHEDIIANLCYTEKSSFFVLKVTSPFWKEWSDMGEKSNKWSSETVKKLANFVSDEAQLVLEEERIKAEPLMKDVKAATKP